MTPDSLSALRLLLAAWASVYATQRLPATWPAVDPGYRGARLPSSLVPNILARSEGESKAGKDDGRSGSGSDQARTHARTPPCPAAAHTASSRSPRPHRLQVA